MQRPGECEAASASAGRAGTSRSIGLITRGLVVFQILVTCILLIGALLQVRSLVQQESVFAVLPMATISFSGARFLAESGAIDADAIVIGEPAGIHDDWDHLHLVSRGIAQFTVGGISGVISSGLPPVKGTRARCPSSLPC
jgi:hypothetical protein